MTEGQDAEAVVVPEWALRNVLHRWKNGYPYNGKGGTPEQVCQEALDAYLVELLKGGGNPDDQPGCVCEECEAEAHNDREAR